VKDIPSW